MRTIIFILTHLFLLTLFISCNDKKYTEVVEVPLPAAEEKVIMGIPDDVKADEGSFFSTKYLSFNNGKPLF